MEDRVDHSRLGVAFEGWPPGNHLVKDGSRRPDVGAPVGLLALRLLRRHIRWSPESGAGYCELRRVLQLCEAEVGNLHLPLRCDQQISWLDITMDNILAVRGLQALQDLRTNIERLS